MLSNLSKIPKLTAHRITPPTLTKFTTPSQLTSAITSHPYSKSPLLPLIHARPLSSRKISIVSSIFENISDFFKHLTSPFRSKPDYWGYDDDGDDFPAE